MSRSDLEQARAEKDEFFHYDPHSPLTKEQREDFGGLNYFPENPEFNLEVEVELIPERPLVAIQTSTGDQQVYFRYGTFAFEVGGAIARLTIYAAEDGYFFLPFIDIQAGKETYPAGRYLEPVALSATRFIVDFNQAYNPYCAYNDRWSCPLTPAENRISVAIQAGEKIYSAH